MPPSSTAGWSGTGSGFRLGLGVALLLCLFLGVEGKRFPVVLCLLMLATVASLHWFLTPEMEKLAAAVDFVRGRPSRPWHATAFGAFRQATRPRKASSWSWVCCWRGAAVKRSRRRRSVEIE